MPLYSTRSISRLFQTAAMSRSASSMATSLLAVDESSSMKSLNLGNCSSIIFSSVKSALVGSKLTPMSLETRATKPSSASGFPWRVSISPAHVPGTWSTAVMGAAPMRWNTNVTVGGE